MARETAAAARRERSDLAAALLLVAPASAPRQQEREASLARLQRMSEQTEFQLAAAFGGNGFNTSYDSARPIAFGHMHHNYFISSPPAPPELAREREKSSHLARDQSPHFALLSRAQEALVHHRKMQLNTMQQNAAVADADVCLTLGTANTAAASRTSDLKSVTNDTQQFTMFYAGKICVYDNMPVHKAQAIMLLAGSIASGSSNATNIAALNLLLSAATESKPSSQSGQLPQARKASLARFLEKRKERSASTSPYPSKSLSCSPSQSNNDQEAGLTSTTKLRELNK